MKTKHSLPDSCTSYHDAVRLELERVMTKAPLALCDMLRYHMGWQDEHGYPCNRESGKFIRPTLCLLSCQAVGGDTSRIMPAAAAIELIHKFSLIHDDIEDASHERHHRPTVWKLWGQPQAINAGDAMFTLAYSALLELKENGITDERTVGSTRILSQACWELCDGQYLDLEYESRLDITIADYLNMAARKTAALFAASTSLGAYLGSEDSKLVDLFHLFGKDLGMAYQIRDDIMGIWGMEESTGKSASDIAQRKKTLPVVHGLQNSKGKMRERLQRLYCQDSIEGEEIPEVTKILEQLGARDYAENLAEQYYHKALAQLKAARLDTSRQAPLEETARFLWKRDF
ncbi:MAG: polyprenyl synthetase family protein [Dehalococcoidia bacterium]